MSADLYKTIVYTGSSMSPTLKTLDRLYVIPYHGQRIQCGEVIVFISPEVERTIVHRVVHVDSQGIRTRGDNSSYPDPWVLSPDNIVGRVVYAERKNKRLPIYRGLRGRLYSLGIRAMRMIDSKVSSLLRPTYHRLARTDALRRCLPAQLKIRILSFDRSSGTELQLLIGRRVIGRLLPGRNQWHIQRPFRLFINEASLPRKKVPSINNPASSESREF